ncbi:MAG: hypothetical protein ACFWUD_08395 [Thermocaproicibacter melissae]|jgi:Ca2+/Na+ antiporter|uniref:hypothetical protein n=1 Tax=Thermocaproicibacter melissae TaxID=2966552 RepID=UPI003A1032B4
MRALYFLLALTCFFALLLPFSVTVQVEYREKASACIRYLFFRFHIPSKKKKEKEEKPAEEKAPPKNRLKKLYEAKGLSGFLSLLKEATKIASEAASEVFRHTVFHRFWLNIRVGGEDASAIAVDYGKVCGAVSSGVGVLLGCARCKDCKVNVLPDFCSEKSTVSFRADASVLAFFLVKAAVRAIFRSIRLIKVGKAVHNI